MRLRHGQHNDLISWESEILGNGVLPVDGANAENCYIEDTIKIGAGTKIYPNVIIVGEGYIGEGSVIGPGNRIENPRIGKEVRMKHSCGISHATIDNFTNVSEFVTIADFDGVEKKRTFIGSKCMIGVQVRIMGGSQIEEECFVADGARVSGFLSPRTYFNSEKALKDPQYSAYHTNCAWYLAGYYLAMQSAVFPDERAEFIEKIMKRCGGDEEIFKKWLKTPIMHMGGQTPLKSLKKEGGKAIKCLLGECMHGVPEKSAQT
ncbi:hypothetical protein A3G55_04010 [Candidatus Giovannonibacteria bacterium RIFCSPLOWO2_12_FULL_44_25]|uniref:Bifunctional protein GlmU n=3 Tax=Candidatus Giovannoniibacteriota TaxID=1752738 RepID=A0A0G1IC99_9BACT|nr:MAG: Bifunctional protein GlmU [Parcubacteria group bacterium GW2011_GWC1_44_10]KKT57006.1 MAG: Bifunctional protein GlmU [Candidatus Giovannonibacteria bacterium GW2011_GWB1_44_23]KKT59617.1 MAG: Bifunctional protein GlmU [Candidatus Giovannonibacteria bacterium GW2011_GWA1_44_25]OGF49837.1 MAG: hypothetical protein A2120_01295 [Candidatus Giovannonibacteria bacterium GWA2_45_15]OGF60204.1 MAG: hypothetical protein A2656_00065 [Candidatus Giovannonibacteria bacterium RIFCSPHIGHO2_01_FULL_44